MQAQIANQDQTEAHLTNNLSRTHIIKNKVHALSDAYIMK